MSSSKKELVQVSSYSRRLKDNVKSILENYGEILRTSKVSVIPLNSEFKLFMEPGWNGEQLLRIVLVDVNLSLCR